MIDKYILDDNGQPVLEPDLLTWGRWLEESQQRVLAQNFVGEAMVSTVFLGINHRFIGNGPPILWETMVFGGTLDGAQQRYESREEALRGHQAWIRKVNEAQL